MIKKLFIVSLIINIVFLAKPFLKTSPIASQKATFSLDLPFYPDSITSQSIIGQDDDMRFRITTNFESSDPDYSDNQLCQKCIVESRTGSNNEVKLIKNPGRSNPISILIIPQLNNYDHVYSFQIDKLDPKTLREIEFTYEDTSFWLQNVTNW